MKKFMEKLFSKIKESFAGILIAFLVSFMLMFYEPLNLFVGSIDDFWFDIYAFLPIILLQFLISFLAISLFFIIINIISKKLYKFVLVAAFILTFISYIQGNFLIYNLPGLDGSPINFDAYKTDKIISYILWVVVTGASLITLYKIKFEKFEKVIKFITIGVQIMLLVALISLLTKPHVFDKKEIQVATFDNFNDISSNKNFLIFVIDQADSKTFDEQLSTNWDKETMLEDFTYYPDTTSTYLWTILSIPYILTGQYYENDVYFHDYFTEALDNSQLLSELEKNNYTLNIYEDEELLNYDGDNLDRFDNIKSDAYINKNELVKQEAKYILFKYLPYQLKWRAKADTIDISSTKENNGKHLYTELNYVVYDYLKNYNLNLVDNNYFQFVHIEGAHPPFRYDKDLNFDFDTTYEKNINGSISMLNEYLKRLKAANAFDNSVIIILADHGHGNETIERGNPILYIKGLNEKHDYKVSDKKISFENLNDAYMQLMNGDTTDQLFQNLNNSERRILYCELYHTYELKEMLQKGNAWDTNTIVETGKEYIRDIQ